MTTGGDVHGDGAYSGPKATTGVAGNSLEVL